MNLLWARFQHGGVATLQEEGGRELFTEERQRLRFRRLREVSALACFRGLPLYRAEDEALPQEEVERRLYTTCLMDRRCPYYFPYSPGHGPKEHLALHDQRELLRERRRTDLRWLLWAAGLGVGGLLLGLLLGPLLTQLGWLSR